MLGALAIAAFIGVTAVGVISFVCDELSEEERDIQQSLRREADQYRRDKDAKISSMRENMLREIMALKKSTELQQDGIAADINVKIKEIEIQLKRDEYEALKEARASLAEFYCTQAQAKLERTNQLHNDIRTTIELVDKQLKSQMTLMRGNALRHFRRELDEAVEKCVAYKDYLITYKRFMIKSKSSLNTEIGEFEFLLPSNFPYKGKLVHLTAAQVSNGYFAVPYCFDLDFVVDDLDISSYPTENPDFTLPFLCLRSEKQKGVSQYGNAFTKKVFNFSQARGRLSFDITSNPRLGILAQIMKKDDRFYYLNYQDMEMRLHWNKLENPKRKPPIGAELRVFPTVWDTTLNKIEVSEIASDALTCFSFEDLPLVVPSETEEDFKKIKEARGLSNSEEEWKIAPFDENELPGVSRVKLQLGSTAILLASVEKDHSYFIFERELEYNEYSMKPEDIFTVVDCRLLCVAEDELAKMPSEAYENMKALSIWVFKEFKDQISIKSAHPGMQYFNKWEEITDKLITYKYKGGRDNVVEMEISDVNIEGQGKVRIFFADVARMNEFYSQSCDKAFNKHSMVFFIEVSKGEYVFIQRFAPDCSYADFFNQKASTFFTTNVSKVNIYFKQFAYVEWQHKRALSQFRVGDLYNPFLQVCAINGKEMDTSEQGGGYEVSTFINEFLNRDASQADAVKRALGAKHIFLIQGPPGTGKTTVIIEMIKQVMSGMDRVLISSQANVAVDNVIQRLFGEYDENTMIRVGSADRMSDKVRRISFEEQYIQYVDMVCAKEGDTSVNQTLLKRWLSVVKPEYGQNPDVGELLLRSRRIVAATCVGLAKKNIGLERLKFDLVIIDEAGKALPAEVLIPYVRAKKVIIIGDHKQLPPTIDAALRDDEKIEIEERSVYTEILFDESFFYRLWKDAPASQKCTLTTQYRMPSAIGDMISGLFYQDEGLHNGEGTTKKDSCIPELLKNNITMVDMSDEKDYKEDDRQKMVVNHFEAESVRVIIKNIRRINNSRIAVITPYKPQKRLLLAALRGDDEIDLRDIDINTVDAFQGDEAEIVLYCTTRAVKPTIYFSDNRRVNVALSRAKNNLIIIGSLKYFKQYKNSKIQGSVLPALAEHIEQTGELVTMAHFEKDSVSNKQMQNFDIIPLNLLYVEGTFNENSEDIKSNIAYFYNYCKFENPIDVRLLDEKYYIANDKSYARYKAARELLLDEVEVYVCR